MAGYRWASSATAHSFLDDVARTLEHLAQQISWLRRSFTFAHASCTQPLPDWIDAHVRALEAIGGVPQLLVPDNTKTAVALGQPAKAEGAPYRVDVSAYREWNPKS
jgi:transposase